MSTPTNEQRQPTFDEETLNTLVNDVVNASFGCGDHREDHERPYEEVLAVSQAAKKRLKSWALSRIEELAKRLDAVREGNVWHGANGGFFSARTGDSYNTLDQALDAELWSASSSGANTP